MTEDVNSEDPQEEGLQQEAPSEAPGNDASFDPEEPHEDGLQQEVPPEPTEKGPILDPEEIEALMASVAPMEQVEALFASLPPLKQPKQVEPYMFDGGDQDGPARYPLFVNLQERMVEGLKDQWSDMFSREVSVAFDRMDEESYRAIITEEKDRVFFAYFVEGYGRMMLTFEIPLIVAYVDAMLGGDGEAHGEPSKILSSVERRLSERIAKSLENLLETAWEPVSRLDFEMFKIDTDPQFLSVAGATENCFSMCFNIQLDERLTAGFAIYYPRTFLEPMLENLRSTVSDESIMVDEEWRSDMDAALSVIPMTLRLRLGQCSMTIEQFLKMQVGDYLPLKVNESDPITLFADTIPMFQAQAGSQDGMLAAEIIGDIE